MSGDAKYWSREDNGYVRCELCPHRCDIGENRAGICGVRENRGGVLAASGYGRVSSIALDPIEKKPLYMFHPGKYVLSIGGYGCNLRCPFCQNYEISKEFPPLPGRAGGDDGQNPESESRDTAVSALAPDDILKYALKTIPDGNIGVAYTYNEPLTGYEFLYDCAQLVRRAGLLNVIVTNGFINKEPLMALLPLIDAMNIDLKGFTDTFYERVGGTLDTVKETIDAARRFCHVEVTTLIIPGENEGDIMEISKWLASVDDTIPLHLSRFFPRYRYNDRAPTPREAVFLARDIAGKYLKNVFVGNV